jgi:acetyl-CoA/propionyl-CoA carboxylase biotin carboxyl carrier protein
VSPDLRQRLGDAAVALARAAGYRNAGTAEFLVLADGSFAFLEVNARLQVEHPVTEAVTGVDIVRAQLELASGEPMRRSQRDVTLRGHAIEARIYAEDPANGFLPTGGRVEGLTLPAWPGVRVDCALREGDEVGIAFDPLLAKVTAHAEDRDGCLRKLRAALGETLILGVRTNLGFLLELLSDPDVVAGHVDTGWIERTWRGTAPSLPAGVTAAANDGRDPWRTFGVPDDTTLADVATAGGWAQFRGWGYPLAEAELGPTTLAPPGGSLAAPMPGTVLDVPVAVGDRVAEGTVVTLLEAMKIQVTVRTPTAGMISAVHVRAGDVVTAGQRLIEIEGDEG